MNKKYELTPTIQKTYTNSRIYRIKALKDFNDVRAGDLGGYVESESNLSHDGDCWIYDNAMCFRNGIVLENASIRDNAEVYGNAVVKGKATLRLDAKVFGDAQVYGSAYVTGLVWNNAKVFDNAHIHTSVFEHGVVCKSMEIKFSSCTSDLTKIENINENIRCQTNLPVLSDENGNYVLGFKHVLKTNQPDNFVSKFDTKFEYKINEWAVAFNPILSDDSCASGLHFSHLSYWEHNSCDAVIQVKCYLDDIITIQYGKIRCKKLLPLAVVKNGK